MLCRAQQRNPGHGVRRLLGEDPVYNEGEARGQVDGAPGQHDLGDDWDHRELQGFSQPGQDPWRYPECDQANLGDPEET